MIGRDYSDIYVTACGEPCQTRTEGKRHEQHCPNCQCAIDSDEVEPVDPETVEDLIFLAEAVVGGYDSAHPAAFKQLRGMAARILARLPERGET